GLRRAELQDGQPRGYGGRGGPGSARRDSRRPAPRNVQPAPGDVRIDVVPIPFTAGSYRLEHFVWSGSRRLLSQADRPSEDDHHRGNYSKSIHIQLLSDGVYTSEISIPLLSIERSH